MTKRTARGRAEAESAAGLQGVIDSADEMLESLTVAIGALATLAVSLVLRASSR